MRRLAIAVLISIFCAGASKAGAQVEPSGYQRQMTVTVGAFGSGFQMDYAGTGVAKAAPNLTYGVGTYVDVKFTRWVGVEGEARWSRFNQYVNIYEDNYLIGPRVPIHRFQFMDATPYGKVLFGVGNMNFEFNDAHGRFGDIAFGGGVDLKLSRRVSLRAFDFEYQDWPNWHYGTLKPYGASVGIGYRVY
jgi:hypothetical protein